MSELSKVIHKASYYLKMTKHSLYRHAASVGIEGIRHEMSRCGNDELLTVKEVCTILKCSRSSVYRWCVEEGKIPYYILFGTSMRIKTKDLYEVIEKCRVESVVDHD